MLRCSKGAASADSDGERWDGKRRGRRGRDGSGGGGSKRSHMAKLDPGAPIAGALLRMDEWPPDCDIEGNPLPSAVRCMQALTLPVSLTVT
jgi:hypothetical protein